MIVDERPTIVDGVWTLAVTLPPEVDVEAFLAATVAENVPWLPGEVLSSEFGVESPGLGGTSLRDGMSTGQTVRVPIGLGYSAEEQEQLTLVAAKVLYYLRGGDQEAGTAGDASALADGSA